MDQEVIQSEKQKIIALVQSEHAGTVLNLLRTIANSKAGKLVGDSEYNTIVNAVTFDTQQDMILEVIRIYESVKDGTFISQ